MMEIAKSNKFFFKFWIIACAFISALFYSIDVKSQFLIFQYKKMAAERSGDSIALKKIKAMEEAAETQAAPKYIFDNPIDLHEKYIEDIELCKRMAEKGDAVAQNAYGTQLDVWQGNYSEALIWYEKAAKQGNGQAYANLGVSYFYGNGVERDYKKALLYLDKALTSKDCWTKETVLEQIGLSYYYLQDYSNALIWLHKAAEEGQTYAMFVLGVIYQKGKGVEKNNQIAFEWFTKSAKDGKGEYPAMLLLGNYYYEGKEIPKDDLKAFYWWSKAAGRNEEAQYKVGACYWNGIGVEINRQEAIEWFKKSAKNGYKMATEILDEINKGE